jgi:hypothetical protein
VLAAYIMPKLSDSSLSSGKSIFSGSQQERFFV